jgi:hypothetical protein
MNMFLFLNFSSPSFSPSNAILATISNDSLGVSIDYILRLKIKWIQKEFNMLSQEAWVKNV